VKPQFIVSESTLIARGAPTEEVMAFTLEGEMSGETLANFDAACAARGCGPAELLARILEVVASDNLFAAVLD
jgi:hypothetical protein